MLWVQMRFRQSVWEAWNKLNSSARNKEYRAAGWAALSQLSAMICTVVQPGMQRVLCLQNYKVHPVKCETGTNERCREFHNYTFQRKCSGK